MKARTHWTAILERFAQDELPGEEWREVAGAPGYRVSNLGRVLSTRPINGRGSKSGPPRILVRFKPAGGALVAVPVERSREFPDGEATRLSSSGLGSSIRTRLFSAMRPTLVAAQSAARLFPPLASSATRKGIR